MIAHTSNELFLGKGDGGVKEWKTGKEGEIHEEVQIGGEMNGKESGGQTNRDIIESDAPSEQASQPSIPQPPLLLVAQKKGLRSILSRFLSKLGNFFKRSSKATQHAESQLTEPSFEETKSSDVEEAEPPSVEETQSQMSTEEIVPCLTATLEADPDNIQELFSNFLQDLQDKVTNAKEKNEVLLSH